MWKIIGQFFEHPNSFINNSKFVFQKCSLKFSLSSSLRHKWFWIFTVLNTKLLKYKSGCFSEHNFLENITSWVCLVGPELKTIFHCSAYLRKFLKSLFSTFAASKGSKISENKEVWSANSFILLFKLFARSLIYIKLIYI